MTEPTEPETAPDRAATPAAPASHGGAAADVAITLLLAAAGGFAAHLLSFPAPFLVGSAIVVIAAAFAGQRVVVPVMLRNACFTAIGLSIGASATPEAYAAALRWPISFAILAAVLLLILGVGSTALARVWNKDRMTALLAASPGHLSYVLGLALEGRCDVKWVGIVQSVRVAVLTIAVPFAIVLLGHEPAAPPAPESPMSPTSLAATVAMSVALGFGLQRAGLPAAFLLGGMLVSTGAHLSDLAPGGVPAWLAVPSFAVMGAIIATRFSGVTVAELRRAAAAGLTFTGIAFGLAGLGAVAVATLLDLPLAVVLVAFAPGGLEAMAAMAITLDLDPTFVAAHHVFRLLLLTLIAPWALRYGTGEQPPPTNNTDTSS